MSSSGGEAQKVDEGGRMYTEVGQHCLGCFGIEAAGVGIEAMTFCSAVSTPLRRKRPPALPINLLSGPFCRRWRGDDLFLCCLSPTSRK